jgi:hypothetical protein
MEQEHQLDQVACEVEDAAEDGDVTLGELVDRLGARGFGPLYILLSALVLLPIGMIPMLPAAVGALIVLLSAQLLAGRNSPWLGGRLRRMTLDHDALDASVQKARPVIDWLERLVCPRAAFLAEGAVALKIAALAMVLLGILMIVIGFIPALPFLLGLPVLCFGIGMTARDGYVMALGYALILPPVILLLRQI